MIWNGKKRKKKARVGVVPSTEGWMQIANSKAVLKSRTQEFKFQMISLTTHIMIHSLCPHQGILKWVVGEDCKYLIIAPAAKNWVMA